MCLNEELTSIYQEVLNNLEGIHGALLRMNRSIQAEGTFGVIKYDRWYKRLVRRCQIKVELEIYLVSIGFNLHKFYTKQIRLQKAARGFNITLFGARGVCHFLNNRLVFSQKLKGAAKNEVLNFISSQPHHLL
ncbi:transposase [Pseudoruminococcus massiliensis]|uniref:transposase n=1 Tax=Pseudoruminococcus massiliensis TaxID=2086583 RepID=UPI003AB634F2